ncbi:uncharacterized protein LOC128240425 [Mya arenaria]|uniref:uncharacterized protein LOC128240425 n=1 Tax=Mya arenaria TaxID=6604 RepID=UPI0022E3D6A7|nr:uncharacterized protein LOC128240425 [Mya arenaria]
MECTKCRLTKPINEFPSQTVLDACKHPAFSCLRCIVKSVEDDSKCPECPLQVLKDNERVAFFKSQLHYLFKEYTVNSDDGTIIDCIDQDHAIAEGQEYQLYIVLFDGQKHKISCDKESTVLSLKSKIKAVTKKDECIQRLFFRDKEMPNYSSLSIPSKLTDFNIPSGSSLKLVIVLQTIKEDEIPSIVFELSWEVPETQVQTFFSRIKLSQPKTVYSKEDCVDCTCFIFSGHEHLDICDYKRKNTFEGIRHSGDIFNETGTAGSQKMVVDLKTLSLETTHLFFTISSYNSEALKKYKKITLSVYEQSSPEVKLCELKLNKVKDSQAVIVCRATRNPKSGSWQVCEMQVPSKGTALEAYGELIKTLVGVLPELKTVE